MTGVWPEVGQVGKQALPLRWLLSHQAGLPAVSRPIPIRAAARDPESMLGRTFANPILKRGDVNARAWRAAEMPAMNGHGDARSCGALAE